MAIQEALIIVTNKSRVDHADKKEDSDYLIIASGLQYLFDCYDRVEEEQRQYPKVKNIFSKLIISINLTAIFIIYRGVIL